MSDRDHGRGRENGDVRLYVPEHEGWSVHIKSDWENEFCFTANPGENFFHSLLNGELYLKRGNEKFCLNCAVRQGFLTFDRGYWQKSASSIENQVEPPEGE